MARSGPLFATSRQVERTLDMGRAHVRLEVQRLPNGRARVLKAERKRPGDERYSRARHLEYQNVAIEQLGLEPDALDDLPEVTP